MYIQTVPLTQSCRALQTCDIGSMAAPESAPTLNNATKSAINDAVQVAIEAAVPRIITTVTDAVQVTIEGAVTRITTAIREQLQADTQQQGPSQASQVGMQDQTSQLPPRTVLMSSPSSIQGGQVSSARAERDEPELIAKDVIARLLKMNESTKFDEIFDWDQLLGKKRTSPFKIGSRGAIEYSVHLTEHVYSEDLHSDYGCPGHSDPDDNHGSFHNFCLCHVNERFFFSHSHVCRDNTTGIPLANDIGRFFQAGRLMARKPNEHWKSTPFAVAKSLTEGGFWIVAMTSLHLSDEHEPGFHSSDDDSDSTQSSEHVDYRRRARSLEGVGKIAYARLPDSVIFDLARNEKFDRREWGRKGVALSGQAEGKSGQEPNSIDDTEELDFEPRYCGGFVIQRSKFNP